MFLMTSSPARLRALKEDQSCPNGVFCVHGSWFSLPVQYPLLHHILWMTYGFEKSNSMAVCIVLCVHTVDLPPMQPSKSHTVSGYRTRRANAKTFRGSAIAASLRSTTLSEGPRRNGQTPPVCYGARNSRMYQPLTQDNHDIQKKEGGSREELSCS